MFLHEFETFIYTQGFHFEESPPIAFEEAFAVYYIPEKSLVFHLIHFENRNFNSTDPSTFSRLSEFCEHQSIQIVHIWEDQWITKREIVKSRISHLLGISNRKIHGRSTNVIAIDQTTANNFLDENHLQGTTKAKYKYGLVYQDQLVAVSTFGRSVPIQRNGIEFKSHELIRFANINSSNVQGGFSKLLKHFIKIHHPDDIFTSVDRDWSFGKGYEKLGFVRIGKSAAQGYRLDEQMRRLPLANSNRQHTGLKVYNSGSLKYLLLLKNVS